MRSDKKGPPSRADKAPREDDSAYISGFEPTRSVRAADHLPSGGSGPDPADVSGYEATEAVHLDDYGGIQPIDTEPNPNPPPEASAPPRDNASFSVPLRVDEASFGPPEARSSGSGGSSPRHGEGRSSTPSASSAQRSAASSRHDTPGKRTGPPRPRPEERQRPQKSKKSDREKHDPNIGRELGSYRLISLLGSGGMGKVYKAEHVMLGRMVALKLLRPEYTAKRDAVHRFFQEARAVNAIGHENIVDISDYVELNSGETFFIMELLEGKDLGEILRHSDEPIPLRHAMKIALEVCEALHAAHETEIIHRDLKPDNIFIVNNGRRKNFVKLLDFGVAKLQGEASAQASYQTAVGSVIGTPAYMSPEQASGITVDRRTDIYSLGAILYEMFTGRPVFDAKSFGEFVVKHMNDTPVRPRDLKGAPKIPIALEQVILRCLEKDPNDRYDTVDALRADLARSSATVETPLERYATPRRRRRRWIAIPVAIGLLALAGVAFWIAAGLDLNDLAGSGDEAHAPPPMLGGAETAAAEKVAPKSAAATPTRVSLRTRPPGASVFRKGETRRLCKTTCSKPLGQLGEAGKSVTLVFELPGYKTLEKSYKLDDEADVFEIDEVLQEAPITAIAPERRKPRRARRRARKRRRPKVHAKKVDEATPRPKTKPPKKKPPKKVGKTDQLDPFAQ